MTCKAYWIPACAGMTEEGHLDFFYFRGDKKSFLRKQESINYNFHSWGWAKLPMSVYYENDMVVRWLRLRSATFV